MGLGQYTSLGEYCGPHTASSVFLILVPTARVVVMVKISLGVFSLRREHVWTFSVLDDYL